MEISEVELIRRIRGLASSIQGKAVVGIGDDTAVVEGRPGFQYLLTTDALVEGTHFRWDIAPACDIGRKSLAVNCSDVAAMGGRPLFALVSLGIPVTCSSSVITEFYEGMFSLASQHSVEVSGGDIVRSPVFFASVSLLGEVDSGKFVRRCGARPGDGIYVTGSLGCAAAGLECLLNDVPCEGSWRERLVRRWRNPSPRINEARQIAPLATSMIDTSDGLSSDLAHILEESGVGAELWEDALPIVEELRAYCELTGKHPTRFVLEGGEDYEILFTSSCVDDSGINFACPVTMIGRITRGNYLVLIGESNHRTVLEPKGWDHFGAITQIAEEQINRNRR